MNGLGGAPAAVKVKRSAGMRRNQAGRRMREGFYMGFGAEGKEPPNLEMKQKLRAVINPSQCFVSLKIKPKIWLSGESSKP